MEGNQMLQKVIRIDDELCIGCGVCMDECSAGAIQLVEQQAVIDESRCTQCGECAKACPNGAIIITMKSVEVEPSKVLVINPTQNSPTPPRPVLAETQTPSSRLAAIAGPALAFLGQEVAPRLVDVLVNTLEHRLEKPKTNTVAPLTTTSSFTTTRSEAKRRRARIRGRHKESRNYQERR
jgi:Fe-S-cluster-containing hydrogenase component 2